MKLLTNSAGVGKIFGSHAAVKLAPHVVKDLDDLRELFEAHTFFNKYMDEYFWQTALPLADFIKATSQAGCRCGRGGRGAGKKGAGRIR